MSGSDYTFIDREVSWLAFSDRVLQEAADPTVPALERLLFCAIFSSNLDEWFRVRVASLRNLLRLGEADTEQLGFNPARLLHRLQRSVFQQQEKYGGILRDGVLPLLETNGIFIPRGEDISRAQREFVVDYFHREVEPHLGPIALASGGETPTLENRGIYLVVELWSTGEDAGPGGLDFALIRVPGSPVPRFLVLPEEGGRHQAMFLVIIELVIIGEEIFDQCLRVLKQEPQVFMAQPAQC